MNDMRQKLLSAGLSAVVLLGACVPLTAMAAQTSAPQAQQSAAGAPIKTNAGAAGQAAQTPQFSSGNGQGPASAPAGQAQTQPVDQENENNAAQQAQLAAQAKITEAEAIAAAQAAYPGSTATVKELDGENGSVFYELKVQPADGSKPVKVSVDAVSGTLSTHKEESGETDENGAAQQAQLAAQAKITEAEAIAAVQAAYPGSTVTVKELDGEGGKVIYDLKVQPADGGKAFEAAVDAVTGELLANEADD